MVDLFNHYANEQCTTEIVHVGLERESDKQKRTSLEYRKLRGEYDLSLLIPESRFDPGNRKSNPVHFVESFSRTVHDYQELGEEDEEKLALDVAQSLLDEYTEVEVWDIPDWSIAMTEDNDSSEEKNSDDSSDSDVFFDQV